MSKKMTFSPNKEYNKVSRYQILRVISEEDGARYLETYNQTVVPEKDNDIYHIVKVSEEGRLDIISQNYYGTPTYWWAIALANNFIDPFTVNSGTLVRIPRITDLVDPENEILSRRSV